MIYDLGLASELPVSLKPYPSSEFHLSSIASTPIFGALFWVNKQVHFEATSLFYALNTIAIGSIDSRMKVVQVGELKNLQC